MGTRLRFGYWVYMWRGGGYAVFEKSNQAGTAMLLILAAIFLLIGVQGTPLIKFGSSSGSVELERRRRRKVQEALGRWPLMLRTGWVVVRRITWVSPSVGWPPCPVNCQPHTPDQEGAHGQVHTRQDQLHGRDHRRRCAARSRPQESGVA